MAASLFEVVIFFNGITHIAIKLASNFNDEDEGKSVLLYDALKLKKAISFY